MAIEYLIGKETPSKYTTSTQVFKATHDKAGKRLPYMYRSFISFSYGGKIIEDFNLIAITEGDRITKNVYANFEDNVETYDVIDGQFYWGSHYTNNQLELTLATDGITQKELDDFKAWFIPGHARELILAEHPNRAIMARVSVPPVMNLLPFEYKTSIFILGKEYQTSITQYKGTINLSFVMDEPHWYAKYSLINPYAEGEGANGVINIAQDPERIRDRIEEVIHMNDGAQTDEERKRFKTIIVDYKNQNGDIVQNVIHIKSITLREDAEWNEANERIKGQYWKITGVKNQDYYKIEDEDDTTYDVSYYYPDEISFIGIPIQTLEDNDYAKIVLEDNIPYLSMIKDDVLIGEGMGVGSDFESRIYNEQTGRGAHILYYGYIGKETSNGNGYTLDNNNNNDKIYLYYSGTAPSKPILKFTFTPSFDENTGYIKEPYNSYVSFNEYDYIAIDSKKFYFTTPSLLTGYNQALKILRDYVDNGGRATTELLQLMKENVNEYYARAWAVYSLQQIVGASTDGVIGNVDGLIDEFIVKMKKFICSDGINPNPVSCEFNSKTGEAVGTFTVKVAEDSGVETIKTIAENIGDMVRSDYLIIEGRNYPNTLGYITKRECHGITTNYSTPLRNVYLEYQNMYL